MLNVKVTNMVSSRGNKVANQFVIEHGDFVTFQSYSTQIATFNTETKELEVGEWSYSRTTMKYFKMFINDYTDRRYESADQWRKVMRNEGLQ